MKDLSAQAQLLTWGSEGVDNSTIRIYRNSNSNTNQQAYSV